jgi:hypothetical protein
MANPSVTYTFTNGTTADGTQVSQNFTDLINSLTDGTKSLNIDAITAAGTATFNGNTIIGNASGDTVTVNGTFSGTGGQVSNTAPGIFPAANSSFSDATATRLGYKSYVHGTNYNEGNAPTVSLYSGGGSIDTVKIAIFTPYQKQDDSWWLKISLSVLLSVATRTGVQFAINGVTFKAITSGFQPLCGQCYNDATFVQIPYCGQNTNRIIFEHGSTSSNNYAVSGEVLLESKPTWAY